MVTFDSSFDDEILGTIYYATSESVDLDFTPAAITFNQISASILNYNTSSYSTVIGDGILDQFTITHNFNTREALVYIRESSSFSSYENVIPDIYYTTVNDVTLNFNVPPTLDQYVVNVVPFTSSLGTVYTQNVGNGVEQVYTITHDLNSKHVFVMVRENTAPYERVYPDIYFTSNNQITMDFNAVIPVNAVKVNIIG